MKHAILLTTALAGLLALSAPAAQAGRGDGIALNGPALDGRQVALPDGLRIGAPAAEEAQRIATNGPALDGRQVALTDGLRIGAPDVTGLAIDRLRLPSDVRGILPSDQRTAGSEQDQQAQ